MKRIINMDNPVFSFFYTLADLVIANMMTFLCCLPVVTIGAALAANHYVTQSIIYKTGGSLIRTYFKKFIEYFKHATIVWLVQVFVLAVLGFNMYLVLVYFNDTFRNILIVLMALFALFILAVDALMVPLLVRYDNKLSEHFHNAVILFSQKFMRTLILIILKLFPIILGLVTPTVMIYSIPYWVLIGISLTTLISNWLLKSTFLDLEDQRDARLEEIEE